MPRSDRALPPRLARLRQLTSDNPVQRRNIADLARQIDTLVARRDASVELIRRGETTKAIALFRQELESRRMRGIRDRFDAMNTEERRLLDLRADDLRFSVWLFYVVLVASAALLVVLAITSLATVLSYTRDLARSQEALRALKRGRWRIR